MLHFEYEIEKGMLYNVRCWKTIDSVVKLNESGILSYHDTGINELIVGKKMKLDTIKNNQLVSRIYGVAINSEYIQAEDDKLYWAGNGRWVEE